MSFGFPMGKTFCGISFILRNTIVMSFASQAAAISVVKYFYIFVFKHPSDRNDTFWCFYVNSVVFLLGFLSQFVFIVLPGKNPFVYYHCSQTTPLQGLKVKINYVVYINLLVSFVVYAFVVFKILWFKLKILPNNAANVAQNLKESLSNLKYFAISFLSILPLVIVTYILNLVPVEKLHIFPNNCIQRQIHKCDI